MDDPKIDHLLEANGLEKYTANFRAHAIRSDVLLDLTAEDLIEIGVSSLGHRIQLLKIVAFQRQATPRFVPMPSSASASAQFASSSTSLQRPPQPQIAPSLGITAASNASNSSLLSPSFAVPSPGPGASSREVQVLRQRLDVSEKHIKKLGEQVARLRADLFRKFKESEPLPTPTGRSLSPGSATPAFIGKRTPSDGYFTRNPMSSSSAVKTSSVPNTGVPSYGYTPSPGGHRSTVHVFHGHFQPNSATSNYSPSAPHPPAYLSQSVAQTHALQNANSGHPDNLVITAPSEPFKNFRCGEKDSVSKVLSALFQRKYLEGDISQWRLRIEYGDKSRELLDHEFPLVVFKQLQDQGHNPVFTMKAAQPHKPPPGSYI